MCKPGRALATFMLVAWSLFLVACGGGSSKPDRIQIDPSTVDLDFGEEMTLHAQTVTGSTVADAGPGVTWTSRDATKLQVTTNADGTATIKGLAPGDVTVEASLDDLTATATVTVGAAPITAIGITPPAPSLAKGTVVDLTATATYADTHTSDVTATATWSSTDNSIATVTADGRVRGIAVGTATIKAVKDGVTGMTQVTVTAATLSTIAVTPTTPSLPKGRTVQLTATGTFSDNTTQNLTAMVTWSSGNDAIATVTAGGLVTGAGVGNVDVTATLDGVSGSTSVTITAATLVSLAVTPVNPTIAKGRVQQLTATGTYTDGSTQNLTTSVTWSSSNPVIGSV